MVIKFNNCRRNKTPVSEGDLVAVADKTTELVSIGFFDREWGIICLEVGSEPILFDENKVEILGKVVGFCDVTPNKNGKYTVHSIVLEDK